MLRILDMHAMHLAGVDLNLLVALDALLAERSVTHAAARVGITQPAMSHALARLRDLCGDPLLVRTPRGMLPTPRAEALATPIRRALADIEGALQADARFDPHAAQRTFTLATTDYGELVVLPPLLAHLSREAPGVDLRVGPVPDDLSGALERGDVDLAIAFIRRDASAAIRTRKLVDDRFVCVMRKGHPATKRPLTLERFVALRHAMVAPRGRAGGVVDDALAARGLTRHVVLALPHFLATALVVARSDLVATLAERIARLFAVSHGLAIVKPPLELRGFSIHACWHERRNADPALAWLRNAVADAITAGETAPRRR
jgi:DNA-binding transcriptional LysR family regulator